MTSEYTNNGLRADGCSPLAIYIHYPFCVRKCLYCDFLSSPADSAQRGDYVRQLIAEIRARGALLHDRRVRSIFLGGGTPSLMSASQLGSVMDAVFTSFCVEPSAEISMECNPGTICAANLRACEMPALTFPEIRRCGINRLSLGAQSLDDGELRALGRIHNAQQFLESFQAARKAGFDNINVDLMTGLPGQTMESMRRSLEGVAALGPEHISSYSLIIEEGTPFHEIYASSRALSSAQPDTAVHPPLPDEDTEREMYHETVRTLERLGYTHYEVSNYAKSGYECRHNLAYWYRSDYIGLGLGSSSLIGNIRFKNTDDLSLYMKETSFSVPGDSFRRLDQKDEMEETMFLGLRCCTGVGKAAFRSRFGQDIYEIYGDVIEKYRKLGMLSDEDSHIRLTPAGIDVSNWILADFLL